MKLLAVIERELLAATRRPRTARIRLLFALAGLATFAIAMLPSWLLFGLAVLAFIDNTTECGVIAILAVWHIASLFVSALLLAPARRLVTRRFGELAATGRA